MREITINADQSKSYVNVHEAIIDNGFTLVENHEQEVFNFKNVYKKGEKYYGFIGAESFNTIVYKFILLEVNNMDEFKDYYLDSTLQDLKDEILDEEMTLDDLNSKCKAITDDTEDIFNYNIDNLIDGSSGSFAWGSTSEQRGIFNVEYDVLEMDEDESNILIKVTDIVIL